MHFPQLRAVALISGFLAAMCLASCTNPRVKQMWREEYLAGDFSNSFSVSLRSTFPDGGRSRVVIRERSLRSKIVGSERSGNCRVSYPRGYRSQARGIASMINRSLKSTEQTIGVRVPFTVHFVLLPQKEKPSVISADYECAIDEAVFPMFFTKEHRTPKAILANLLVGMDAYYHEVFEFLLVVPQYPPTVLPDAEGQVYGMGYRSRNYTRWFRDGFATYAGYVTIQNLFRQSSGGWPADKSPSSLVSFHHPLSSFDHVGSRLFSWDQYDSQSKNNDYYNGSFGLFLAMEQRWGRPAVKRLMKGIEQLEFPDGEAIIALCDTTFKTDFKKWVAQFELPSLADELSPIASGMRVVTPSRKGGARIYPGDIVVSIDGKPVRNRLDYEEALLNNGRLDRSATRIKVRRAGKLVSLQARR